MNILLVEDDLNLGRLIEENLQKKSYRVTWAKDLEQSLNWLQKQDYHLAIIDLNLPDGQGFDLVEPLKCPVIIMSALSDPENRLLGAKLGAVDFIPKPFLLQELFLKIERVLGESSLQKRVWTQGPVRLDLDQREITNGSQNHLLNKRDYRLLEILTRRHPQVVSRDEIIDYVYGKDQNPSHRSIDNAVVGIRQRLSDDGQTWVRSVRGEGYQWVIKGD